MLVALAATEASAELSRERAHGSAASAEIDEADGRISTIARGYWTDGFGEDESDEYVFVKGILDEPRPSENVETLAEALRLVHGALRRKLVLLFDGLDRVAELERLASVFAEDVPVMRRAGVGFVVVGPQHLRFSPQRSIEQEFETVHLHGATGVDSPEGQAFLSAVLRARIGGDVLPPESAHAIVRWSGGLMRDLVALGRAACAEAYAGGSDTIQPEHVDIAADRFGRDLFLGCTRDMAARLKELRARLGSSKVVPRSGVLQAFTVATELDRQLLIERLIIEVPGTPVRYVLHPTIVPLIPGLGAS
ncbi:hypothetical protein [Sorangium sp. So ce1000]|uniref:hypothetical protein n=1 Tax=Sorangium sp. So ce1000 TaxID=3133325 RepID=UPI003F6254BE